MCFALTRQRLRVLALGLLVFDEAAVWRLCFGIVGPVWLRSLGVGWACSVGLCSCGPPLLRSAGGLAAVGVVGAWLCCWMEFPFLVVCWKACELWLAAVVVQ